MSDEKNQGPAIDAAVPDVSRRDVLIASATAMAAAAELSDLGVGSAAFAQTAPALSSPFTTRGPAPQTSVATHTTRKLKVETVTADLFAPFGVVLTEAGRKRLPINTYGDKLDLYREGFQSDQPIEWFIVKGMPRWNGVLFLERHLQLSQTFIPVGGQGFYTVVAAPNCREVNGFPVIEELRAFFVPGDTAIQLHRATWHENPMPEKPNTRLLVTSHANLTLAHQQNPDPKLAALRLDLERRWYRAGGFELTLEIG
jgi:ureidoglycolate lyase